jgi:hypothetical protein
MKKVLGILITLAACQPADMQSSAKLAAGSEFCVSELKHRLTCSEPILTDHGHVKMFCAGASLDDNAAAISELMNELSYQGASNVSVGQTQMKPEATTYFEYVANLQAPPVPDVSGVYDYVSITALKGSSINLSCE